MSEQDCSSCGQPLTADEIQYDDDGAKVCDDCWHDKYQFTCGYCEEYGRVEDQHNLLVVFEKISGVLPGIYKVIRHPYCTNAMIGEGWLHPWALERIGDLWPDMADEYYPCGHLCKVCQDNVWAQFTGKCAVCKKPAASCLKVRLGAWASFPVNEDTKYLWTRPKVVCAGCRAKHRGAWQRHRK